MRFHKESLPKINKSGTMVSLLKARLCPHRNYILMALLLYFQITSDKFYFRQFSDNFPDHSTIMKVKKQGRFPFDQKFRDFRSEIEWNGKNSGKGFRKFRNTF